MIVLWVLSGGRNNGGVQEVGAAGVLRVLVC